MGNTTGVSERIHVWEFRTGRFSKTSVVDQRHYSMHVFLHSGGFLWYEHGPSHLGFSQINTILVVTPLRIEKSLQPQK